MWGLIGGTSAGLGKRPHEELKTLDAKERGQRWEKHGQTNGKMPKTTSQGNLAWASFAHR